MEVGSEFTLELELANVGRSPATLIKPENVASKDVELDKRSISNLVENYLDMKGRRLENLKTFEVKVPLKALVKGSFELRPRILFVYEKGNHRFFEFERS